MQDFLQAPLPAPGRFLFGGGNASPETGGAADPSFHFNHIAPTSERPNTATLMAEFSAHSDSNVFGWYVLGNPASKTPIFNGPAAPGASYSFPSGQPGVDYGLYITSPEGSFYTESSFDTVVDGGFQHFAVFKESEGLYWIGMEDRPDGSDRDYQDMIVRINPIPEPATMLLLGSGLIGLAGFARRKFHKK